MQFSSVIGQEEIKQRLIRSVQEERVSHAQLLHGRTGYGTLALAIAYARYIQCNNRSGTDSCGTCSACRKMEKLIHPDVHFVFPVTTAARSDAVSDDYLELWRNFVLESPYRSFQSWFREMQVENRQGIITVSESESILRKLSLKTYEAEYKIMILWLPEKMNAQAANKLLKILEEPPAKTVFILVSENPEHLLPTIRSRTQLIKVGALGDEEIKMALQARGVRDESKIRDAVNLAEGDLEKALFQLERADETHTHLENFIELMRLSYSQNVPGLIGWVDKMAGRGREGQKSFLEYGIRYLRENYLMNAVPSGMNHMDGAELKFAENFHSFIHEDNIEVVYREFNRASNHIEANAYSKVVLLDLSLKLIHLIRKN